MAGLRVAVAGALILAVAPSGSLHAAGTVSLSISGREQPNAQPVTLLNYEGPNAFMTNAVLPIEGGLPKKQLANIDYAVSGAALPGVVRLGMQTGIDAFQPLFLETRFSGAAAFGDTLSFLATEPGFLNLTMAFSGDLDGNFQNLDQTYPGWFPALPRNRYGTSYFVQAEASLTGSVLGKPATTRGDFRNVIEDPFETRGTGFGSMMVSVPFDAGPGPTTLSILMTAGLGCRGFAILQDRTFGGWNFPETFPGARGAASCDTARSLVWTGFSGTTLDGRPHPGRTFIGSESGADYSRSFLDPPPPLPPPVSAPAMVALLGLGAVAIVGRRRRI